MNRPEQALQITLVQLLRGDSRRGIPASLPEPWRVFSTKNHGEQTSRRMHGIHVAMGLLKGMCDLVIVGPGPVIDDVRWPLVFAIELKRPPVVLPSGAKSKAKMRTTEDQDEVLEAFAACGVRTLVANDLDAILTWLRAGGVPLRVRAS